MDIHLLALFPQWNSRNQFHSLMGKALIVYLNLIKQTLVHSLMLY